MDYHDLDKKIREIPSLSFSISIIVISEVQVAQCIGVLGGKEFDDFGGVNLHAPFAYQHWCHRGSLQ